MIEALTRHVKRNDVYFNINFPNTEKVQIKGVKFARLARRRYKRRITIGKDPFQREFYWIGGILDDPFEEGTDSKYVKEGIQFQLPLFLLTKHILNF